MEKTKLHNETINLSREVPTIQKTHENFITSKYLIQTGERGISRVMTWRIEQYKVEHTCKWSPKRRGERKLGIKIIEEITAGKPLNLVKL